MRYIFLLTSVRWWYPFCPARATENWTLLGCQAPMQATLRRPLWVLRGNFLVCHRLVTPARQHSQHTSSNVEGWLTFEPFPLSDPDHIKNLILLKHILNWNLLLQVLLGPVNLTNETRNVKAAANVSIHTHTHTFSAMVPPFICISMMWAFFWRRLGILLSCREAGLGCKHKRSPPTSKRMSLSPPTWVWQMTRMTLQYFFIFSRSILMASWPASSFQRLAALVNALCLHLYLHMPWQERNEKEREGSARNSSAKWEEFQGCTRWDRFLISSTEKRVRIATELKRKR